MNRTLTAKELESLDNISRLAFNRSDSRDIAVKDHQLLRKISNTIDAIVRRISK